MAARYVYASQPVATGAAPGRESLSYGQVSGSAPGRIIGEKTVGGVKYYDIDQSEIGGGTGWVRADRVSVGGPPSGGGSGAGQSTSTAFSNPILEAEKQIREAAEKAFDQFFSRLEEFDRTNPFAFDEALARASARESIDPFYRQQLEDFTRGVERKKTRSLEDAQELVGELAVGGEELGGRVGTSLAKSIEAAREGRAGFGGAQSGQALREEGELRVGAQETAIDVLTKLTRNLEDIGEEKLLRERELGKFQGGQFIPGREAEFDIRSAISAARQRDETKRSLAQFEFAAPSLRGAGVDPLQLFSQRRALQTQIGQLPGF